MAKRQVDVRGKHSVQHGIRSGTETRARDEIGVSLRQGRRVAAQLALVRIGPGGLGDGRKRSGQRDESGGQVLEAHGLRRSTATRVPRRFPAVFGALSLPYPCRQFDAVVPAAHRATRELMQRRDTLPLDKLTADALRAARLLSCGP